MEKTIELLKKYFCMAKLTTNLEGPTEETIECYIPSVCYLINLSIKGMEDKSIIMYTRDPYTLEPLSEENNIPIIPGKNDIAIAKINSKNFFIKIPPCCYITSISKNIIPHPRNDFIKTRPFKSKNRHTAVLIFWHAQQDCCATWQNLLAQTGALPFAFLRRFELLSRRFKSWDVIHKIKTTIRWF